MTERVTRTIVDGAGRPVAEITADKENAAALERLEKLTGLEREALDDWLDELRDLEEEP